MLVRNTTALFSDLFLIKLGDTCRYLLQRDDGKLILVDPGASAHLESLVGRIRNFGLDVSNLQGVVLTHPHHDRVAATVALKEIAPNLEIMAPVAVANELKNEDSLRQKFELDRSSAERFGQLALKSFEDWKETFSKVIRIDDGFQLPLGESRFMRAIATPGHTKGSFAFMVLPHECLIVDETFGYFNGHKLAAPGGDHDLATAITSIEKFSKVEVSVLALPYGGALTGSIVRKHLDAVVQNTKDLLQEVRLAIADGLPRAEITKSIHESFYLHTSRDPFLQASLAGSMAAILKQVEIGAGAP